jgi:hypothetical protein
MQKEEVGQETERRPPPGCSLQVRAEVPAPRVLEEPWAMELVALAVIAAAPSPVSEMVAVSVIWPGGALEERVTGMVTVPRAGLVTVPLGL